MECKTREEAPRGKGGDALPPRVPGVLQSALSLVGYVVVAGLALYLTDIGCVFRTVTGIPCPGCGMTRAWLAVLRLDFAAALAYHPLFWIVPAAIALVCVQRACGEIVARAQADLDDAALARRAARAAFVLRLYNPILIALIVALIALWVIRLVDPVDAGLLFGGIAPAGVPADVIHLQTPVWTDWLA